MNNILTIFLLFLLILQLILVVSTVKRKKMSMKYATFWIFLFILMLIVVVFPDIIFKLSVLLGFETSSNMIFLLGFFFLFYIIFVLSISLSIQNEKIKLLIQEISILKKRVDEFGKKE